MKPEFGQAYADAAKALREYLKVAEDNSPDDCPRCKWRRGCPYGQVYYALQPHRCVEGIFEIDPEFL